MYFVNFYVKNLGFVMKNLDSRTFSTDWPTEQHLQDEKQPP